VLSYLNWLIIKIPVCTHGAQPLMFSHQKHHVSQSFPSTNWQFSAREADNQRNRRTNASPTLQYCSNKLLWHNAKEHPFAWRVFITFSEICICQSPGTFEWSAVSINLNPSLETEIHIMHCHSDDFNSSRASRKFPPR
jgi:hypothetical protein